MNEPHSAIEKQASTKLNQQGIDSGRIKTAIDQAEAAAEPSMQSNSQQRLDIARTESSRAEKNDEQKIDEEKINIQEEVVFEEVESSEYKPAAAIKEEIVYPVIHVEEASRKGIKVLVLGFVGGLILASALSIGGAYLLFGDKLLGGLEQEKPVVKQVISYDDINRQSEIERIKLEAMEKERDAAVAITRALERERDAAIAAAKVQQSMREVEKRAAKIIAEQERKATIKLNNAARRARRAEREAALAKQSENEARLQVMRAKIEAEAKVKAMELLNIARQASAVMPATVASEPVLLPAAVQPAAVVRATVRAAKEKTIKHQSFQQIRVPVHRPSFYQPVKSKKQFNKGGY